MIKIRLSSVLVDDQEKALQFYTEKLGFTKKQDIPLGEFRWLTVGAKDEDIELVLEPNMLPSAFSFQKDIYEKNIPATALYSSDIENDCKNLKEKGVIIKTEPTKMGDVTIALIDDTCGNIIQLYQD